MLPFFAVFAVSLFVGFVVGAASVRWENNGRLGEALEPYECWRRINLAVGDGYQHQEACPTLRGLRESGGYTVEKLGSERTGVVTLKIRAPGVRVE